MLVDLVRTRTPDGWFLDGALQLPESTAASPRIFDAALLIHGTGSNFYQSSLLEFLADRFRERGTPTLRGNTRGHDGISTHVGERGGRRLGAAYEIVDDCRHDLAGWVEFLRGRCGPRVALVGHSLGAVKSLYATAHEPDLKPAAIVAVSPPRLSYEVFCGSPKSAEFLDDYRRAEALVAEGRGGALLDVTVRRCHECEAIAASQVTSRSTGLLARYRFRRRSEADHVPAARDVRDEGSRRQHRVPRIAGAGQAAGDGRRGGGSLLHRPP